MSTEPQILRIGGVPEHFNLPWHLLLESGALDDLGITATWRNYHGGTGSMVRALDDDNVDVAMLLTEGAVAGIAAGGQFKIVSFYTRSPIVWGIHVAAHSDIHSVDDIRGRRYAISRDGSGSQLMALVHAQQQGWPLESLVFEKVGNLDGARDALADGSAEVFLWEKFMTQPYVDNGEFRRIADYPTPWSCFVVCASDRILATAPDSIALLLQAIYTTAEALCSDSQRARLIAARYGLEEAAVHEWLALTRWADSPVVEAGLIKKVADTLNSAGISDIDFSAERFLFPMG